MAAYPRQDGTAGQCFSQHLVNEGTVWQRHLCQRLCQVIGDGELRRNGGGELVFQYLAVKGLFGQRYCPFWRDKAHIITGECGNRQPNLVGQCPDTVGTFASLAALKGTVAVQGDGAGSVKDADLREQGGRRGPWDRVQITS